jgi:hypothetical protein
MYMDGKSNRVESIDINVSDYSDNEAISEAVEDYNRGDEIADRWKQLHKTTVGPEIKHDWRYDLWWTLYAGMIGNLKRWRKRRI